MKSIIKRFQIGLVLLVLSLSSFVSACVTDDEAVAVGQVEDRLLGAGMESDAMTLTAKMYAGCGNTWEAIGGETAWGNPKVTAELIKKVKGLGFNRNRFMYRVVPTTKNWLHGVARR